MTNKFKPTYLCITKHLRSRLLYLCKTSRQFDKMLGYKGSGRYWKRHLKEHGNEVETVWYCLYYDKEELNKFALLCSNQWNIVKEVDINGKKVWANEKPENGLDGGSDECREDTKEKIKDTMRQRGLGGNGGKNKGMKFPAQSQRMKNQIPWNKGKKGLQDGWNKGVSPIILSCLSCRKEVDIRNFSRWHGNTCRRANNNEKQ